MFPACAQLVLVGSLVAWITCARAQDAFPPPVVFFPPIAPVYGAAIPDRQPAAAKILRGRRLTAPDGLADFVGDAFYPAFSTRLFLGVLSAKLEARLHAYRARRLSHVNDLLNEFVVLYDIPPERHEQHLREFARKQTPHLVALESEAEELREDLVADPIWNRIDWNASRRWRLATLKAGADGAEAEAEFQLVRAAAFYQKGLTAQQRGLLRELALELQAIARKRRGLPTTRAESDAMFFSPETARFRLPAKVSPVLREKIGVYNGQKAALKRELREAVAANDGASAADRTRAFEALADKQWPELASLEDLADEIRDVLNGHFEPAPPPTPPWIPGGLMEMIRAYNEDRDTYFAELRQRTEMAMALVPRPSQDGTADERVQRQREFIARRGEALRRATLDFQEQHAARFAALQERYRQIRESLAIVAEKQTDRKTGRALNADTLLQEYSVSMAEFDTFGRELVIYTNYRIAMLQPGLSPEQRRLLFDYALVGLAQPLPHGELMPQRTATRPYATW